ncbi:RrF2 family transcriptional regulator [Convivina intestini]|uniref:RrF2 family transcriptional regulator n=1 Tax=Convivina intestini TaxID=1505726 RepID=UPI00200D41CD|nr:Rrf2 family transcriptional regulator [Convivina intestini]CAH1853235.1 hypothetical protein R078131_00673 [Convivina intestini]
MKFSKGFLQTAALMVMLAELPDHTYLKSGELSQAMGVSHTYLQKTAKKLKDAGLIKAEASKNGGYALNHPIDKITFYDLFQAVESPEAFASGYDLTGIRNMFISPALTEHYVQITGNIFKDAEIALKDSLKSHKLSEIVPLDRQGEILKINWPAQLAQNQEERPHE